MATRVQNETKHLKGFLHSNKIEKEILILQKIS